MDKEILLLNGSPHQFGCTHTALRKCPMPLRFRAADGDSPARRSQHPGLQRSVDIAAARPARYIMDGDPGEYGNRSCETAWSGGRFSVYYKRTFRSDCVTSGAGLYACDSYLKGKPAAAIASCRRSGTTATFDRLNKFFTISQMPVVSSQYWNGVHGNNPDEVLHDLEGMQTMRTLGRNMAWMIKCFEAGRAVGIEFPESEEPIATNFIR